MAFSKRSSGGSSRGPVIDVEFREVKETAIDRPSASPPVVEARLRPVVARARTVAPATASARCIVCGSSNKVRTVKVGAFRPALCASHTSSAQIAALIARAFFG